MKNKRGFSLIELLVGIAIIITATTVVLSIIVSSFRISSKNTSSDRVRQNGNYAIAQLSRMIQFADRFNGVIDKSSGALVQCTTVEATEYRGISFTYQGEDKTFTCSDSSGLTITDSAGINSIIDNKVSVVPFSCKLTCYQDADSSPIVGVSFDLLYGDSSLASEKTSNLHFSTRIKVRNN